MRFSERAFHISGWVLFIVCALFYIVASLESGSWLSLIGSVVFLLACFAFLIPLLRR